MKKTIKVITTIVLIFIISSCNDNMGNELNSQSDIISNLESFNQSFLDKAEQNNDHYTTYGFWDTVGDILVVAGSDIIGAGAGALSVQTIAVAVGAETAGVGYAVVSGGAAVVCGAGASIEAGRHLTSNSIPDDKIGTIQFHQNLDINYPKEFQSFSDVGKNHNDMIVEIKTNDIGSILIEKKELHLNLLNNQYFIEKSEEINNLTTLYANNSIDINELLTDLEDSNLITSNMKRIYAKFFAVYNKVNKPEDIQEIVNFYLNSIASMENLSKIEKESLISSFSVASESPFFWEYQIK